MSREFFSLSSLASAMMLVHSSAFAEVQELDALVVTASGTEHTQMSAPAFTTVIDEDSIRENPSQTVADLIGKSAGVVNLTDPSGRDELQIRGLPGSYTLVLVDGRRVSSSNALWRGGDFDFSSIPRSSIERIEIVRGPMSSLYGADAMGGVINIITKKGTAEWVTSIDASYEAVLEGEDGNRWRTNLSTSGAVAEDVYVRLSGEVYDRDAWFTNEGDDVPGQEEKKARNLSGSVSWDIDNRQTLIADVRVNHDERPYGIYSAGPDYRGQEINRETYGVTHEGDWAWGSTRLNVNYEDGEIDDLNSRYPDPQQRYLEEKTLTAAGSGSVIWGDHGLTAGFEVRDQTVADKVAFSETGEASALIKGVYLQDEWFLTDRLTLTLGGRYDDHEDFDGEFTPRGYLVYQLNDSLSLKGGVAKAYKAPAPHQIIEEYQVVSCGGSCFIPGNPDLVPETSTNYELGFEVSRPAWRMSAVAFRSDVEDMIVAIRDPRSWVNLNEVEIQGVELEGSVDMGFGLSFDGAYTYQDTEENGEDEIAYRPRHKLNAGLNWQVVSSTGIRLGADYFGEQVNYDGDDQSAYTLFDLSVNSQVTPALALRGGVNNLTNVDLTEDADDDYYGNVLGRSVFVGMSYDF
ncbi:TonB-dependent receptor [Marinobacter salinexigens]|uniref:TonB-dependent receptor n=1 Tax=Marinobacter salinexigens TaxID=2919747 RepID=A0A5B0V844_9GAMM|nr:TonB-dependent receptor [Marinobacter salinexigens]KAA1170730.1 TonB-dependent receptor [Marinobacter salinexigens]